MKGKRVDLMLRTIYACVTGIEKKMSSSLFFIQYSNSTLYTFITSNVRFISLYLHKLRNTYHKALFCEIDILQQEKDCGRKKGK